MPRKTEDGTMSDFSTFQSQKINKSGGESFEVIQNFSQCRKELEEETFIFVRYRMLR